MRCPNCSYIFSEELRICPRCKADVSRELEKLGYFPEATTKPFLFPEDFIKSPTSSPTSEGPSPEPPRKEIDLGLPQT